MTIAEPKLTNSKSNYNASLMQKSVILNFMYVSAWNATCFKIMYLVEQVPYNLTTAFTFYLETGINKPLLNYYT
jgi:hypothetical protein